ncbi:MAG: site-2 protease family protein [archaeon]|nr:site-2 protease family protein [archaeon]
MNLYYLTLVLYLFLIYWLIVVALDRKGILERFNISAYGPILMIRTKRGERLLERLAKGPIKERFWRIYANIGTILMVIAMIFMFLVVVFFSNYMMFTNPPEPTKLHEPRSCLLIPGLNPYIPMLAWVGFVIMLVVHELSHAVLSTVEKIKVKSMGLLVALIPIGAFAEPDSEQLFGEKRKENGKMGSEANEVGETETVKKKVATSRERTRILSAGVTSNFGVALIAFVLFFSLLFFIQPIGENVLYVYDVATESPAKNLGIESEMFITMVDNAPVASVEELNTVLGAKEQVMLTVVDKRGKAREIEVNGAYEREGVMIVWVKEGLPAAKAGLKAGMRIIRIDIMSINNYKDFFEFMNNTKSGQVIAVQTEEKTFVVELAESPYAEKGYLGIGVANNPLGMVVVEFTLKEYLEVLRGKASASFMTLSPLRWLTGFLWLMAMPFSRLPDGFSTFNPFLARLYEPVGVLSFLGDGIFWIADVLFWIGWINFYVGLFNCLPAVPLDGGYVFKEMLNPVLRGIKEEKRKEKIVKAIVSLIAIVIFSSIIFMLAGPYLL